MSTRIANLTVLAGILALGTLYFFHTQYIQTASGGGTTLGPQYFPTILAGALFALCVVAVIRELRSEMGHLEMPRKREIALTVALTGGYFAAWQATEQFFAVTPFYVFALLVLYSGGKRSFRSIATSAAVAALFTLAIYLTFTLLLDVRFY